MKFTILVAAVISAVLAGCSRTSDAEKKHQEEIKAILANTTTKGQSASGDEGTARALLNDYLDSWRSGEDYDKFRSRHPDVDTVLDTKSAASQAAGERLVRFEVTPERGETAGIHRYTVTLTLENRGTTKTSVMHYKVYKAPGSGGDKWTISAS